MSLMTDVRDQPIRAFAVVCVAAIAIYLGWMGYRINETLSSSQWCRTALGADQATSKDGTIKGLEACISLLTIQLKSVSTNSHITFGAMALCLVTLIVIVIAGARLAGKYGKDGFELDLDRAGAKHKAAAAGAQHVKAAADEAAAEVDAATPAATPAPAAPHAAGFTQPPGEEPL